MYWTHPGNELKKQYLSIKPFYQDKSIIIYGAGMMGGRIYDALKCLTQIRVEEFWDRNIEKKQYKTRRIRHWIDICPESIDCENQMVVIGLPDEIGVKVREEICKQTGLTQASCKLYSEFVMHDLPIIALYEYNRVFLDSISMIITERCSLRCEKCAIMLPYFHKIHEYSMEKLKNEIDTLFQKVDFIGNYTITGGEPLINSNLTQIVSYIGAHYRDKIGSYKLITNGTIEPSDDLLTVMKRYEMCVEVSDYISGVPHLKNIIEKSVQKYRDNNIQTYFLSTAKWVDFGFETVKNDFSIEEARQFFDYCHTRCRGYVDGKIRYCINAYFAERTLLETEDPDNTFDMLTMSNADFDRRRLVEFDLGYNQKGFLKMCQQCNGTIEINNHFIEVGKQCQNQ